MSKLKEANIELNEAKELLRNLENQRQSDFTEKVGEFFKDCLFGDMTIDNDSYSNLKLRFNVSDNCNEDRHYKREVLSLRVDKVFNDTMNSSSMNVHLNTYSTSNTTRFELKKHVFIGKISSVILEKNNEIIQTYLDIMKVYRLILTKQRTEIRRLYQILRAQEIIRNNQRESELMEKLLIQGIDLAAPSDFWFRANDHVNKVIHISGSTKTGKTYELAVTKFVRGERVEEVISKVKRDYILSFLKSSVIK